MRVAKHNGVKRPPLNGFRNNKGPNDDLKGILVERNGPLDDRRRRPLDDRRRPGDYRKRPVDIEERSVKDRKRTVDDNRRPLKRSLDGIGGRASKGREIDDGFLRYGKNGEYVVVDGVNGVLGNGSFGIVYKAHKKGTHDYVAVKTEAVNTTQPTLPTEIAIYEKIGQHRKYTNKYTPKHNTCKIAKFVKLSILSFQTEFPDFTILEYHPMENTMY